MPWTDKVCSKKHARIWWAIGTILLMIVPGLGFVAFACKKSFEVENKVDVEVMRSIAMDKSHENTLKRIDARLVRMETKADEILETVYEIKRLNGGGE